MIIAAGVLCWRHIGGRPYILVIHRAAHDDYSFPKGKLDPGETVPETALRELYEETRLRTRLGPFLGDVHYEVNGRPKTVSYWTAHVTADQVRQSSRRFTPNHEVDELLWLPFDEAQRLLTYEFDRDLLDQLERMLPELDRPTFNVGVLRHAKATSRASWSGGEASRTLTERGQAQAKSLVGLLDCWAPYESILTSPWQRCASTIAPFLKAHNMRATSVEQLTEAAYAADPAATERLVSAAVTAARPLLICSHRPVLPAILSAVGSVLDEPARARLVACSSISPADLVIAQIAHTDDAEHPFELVTLATYSPYEASPSS